MEPVCLHMFLTPVPGNGQERCLSVPLQTETLCFESTSAFQRQAEAYMLVLAEMSSLGALQR